MANGIELHPENRDKVVAFKLTETERNKLHAHCKKKVVNVSRFIRHTLLNAINES